MIKKTLFVDHDRSYLVNTDEVREVVWCPGGYIIESPWNAEQMNTLGVQASNLKVYIEEVEAKWVKYEPPFYAPYPNAKVVYYDNNDETHIDLQDMERHSMFEYWDGNAWSQKVFHNDSTVRYDLVLDDIPYDLKGNDYVHHIHSVDGIPVASMYLIRFTAGHVGGIDAGSVNNEAEFEEYLQEINVPREIIFN